LGIKGLGYVVLPKFRKKKEEEEEEEDMKGKQKERGKKKKGAKIIQTSKTNKACEAKAKLS
jgi:hypothetical protein